MYVCICNGVTERQVRQAVDAGVHSMRQLRERLPIGNCCGRCVGCAREILNDQKAVQQRCRLPDALPA
ncbi:MAG TPA: bacterioferritin-associated ferredoxin [Steroidobacteraceae bacterium]|nr:bacterioferritin-associated ferredoxin [Steroidobacteraceae bacterium]